MFAGPRPSAGAVFKEPLMTSAVSSSHKIIFHGSVARGGFSSGALLPLPREGERAAGFLAAGHLEQLWASVRLAKYCLHHNEGFCPG